MKKTLKSSEERYRVLFEQAADSMVLFDMNTGAILEFNKKAHENLGYTREEFQAIKMADIDDLESAEDIRTHMEKVRETGSDAFETKHRKKNGEIQDVFVNSRSIKIGDEEFIQSIWRDITKFKRMETALRESEKKFYSLLDLIGDCVYELDKNLVYTYMSPNVKDLSGFGAEDHIGKTPFDFMPPDEVKRTMDLIDGVFQAHRELRNFETVAIRKDGQINMLETNASPIFDAEGNFSGYICVDRNITARKQMESALRESEKKYRSLVDLTSDSVYELDKDFRYTYVSERGGDISGRKPEEHIGKTPFDFMPEEEKERVFEFIKDRIDPPQSLKGFENVLIGQDGRSIVVETSAVPIFDAQGQLSGYLCVDRDITERKQMEMELKQKEEHLRSIVETSQDGIAVFGIPEQLTFANPALASMFGYAHVENIVGTQTDAFFSPESLSVLKDIRERLDAGDEVEETITFKAKRKDGSTFDAEARIGHFFRNEERLEMAVVRDVTEKKRIEHQLNQASKMAAVGELATGVAHEINNPIAAIDVHAGLVREAFEDSRDRIDASSCEQIDSSIRTIEQQIDRCHSITRSLLNFARTPQSEGKTFGINELLIKTVKMVSSMSLSDADVEFNFDHQIPLYWGSPNFLEQVFVNLLTNAFKATGAQGKITVSTNLGDGKNIRIQFTDSGDGIPEDIQERIFDPFFTTSPEGKGTGLGLSISYYIVKQMNGEISVDSILGQGTTFTVTLPVTDGRPNTTPETR